MRTSPMRSFDPRRVGSLECRAWETYYRRKWGAFLVASVGLVRSAFRMSWPRTLIGAWLVLRANMVWAPFPGQRPRQGACPDAALLPAAAQERVGELRPRARPSWRSSGGGCTASTSTRRATPSEGLIVALQSLYAYTYAVDPATCARPRGCAPRRWTCQTAGWRPAATRPNPLLAQERALLVRSYASLLAAVH